MARYNHFGTETRESVLFKDLPIGSEFVNHLFKNKRRRIITCIKEGELSYIEKLSKVKHTLFHSDNYFVYVK